MKNSRYTKKQIQEAIAHWTAVLESMDSEADSWQVTWTDNEEDGWHTASFKTKEEAQRWIQSREAQDSIEQTGFEAEPPQKAAALATGLWDEHGDGGAQDAESFKKAVCSLLKTDEWSFYEQFVPEKYDSFEGD